MRLIKELCIIIRIQKPKPLKSVKGLMRNMKEIVFKELDIIYEDHMKKHINRKMSDKELKVLLGI